MLEDTRGVGQRLKREVATIPIPPDLILRIHARTTLAEADADADPHRRPGRSWSPWRMPVVAAVTIGVVITATTTMIALRTDNQHRDALTTGSPASSPQLSARTSTTDSNGRISKSVLAGRAAVGAGPPGRPPIQKHTTYEYSLVDATTGNWLMTSAK
jgi:hypothetical protein